MKILVTGSRSFNDKELIEEFFDNYEGHIELIIHGGARGADTLAEKYAIEHNINSKIVRPIFPNKKSYYLHRNAEMVGMCDEVVAFWDGASKGTSFTIQYAQARNKNVEIVLSKEARGIFESNEEH